MRKRKNTNGAPLKIRKYLPGISQAFLQGEKRVPFMRFLEYHGKQGVYALYKARPNQKTKLYYVGKASDLQVRLPQHLKDKHAREWDKMTIFFVDNDEAVSEIEALLIATAAPPGNERQPKLGSDLRRELKKFFRKDLTSNLDQMIFPEKPAVNDRRASTRLTRQKLARLLSKQGQKVLADALDVTVGRISQLIQEDRNKYSVLIAYILEGGHRDRVLAELEKEAA